MQRKRRCWCGWLRSASFNLWGNVVSLGVFDYVGIAILLILIVIYVQNFVVDAKEKDRMDIGNARTFISRYLLYNLSCTMTFLLKMGLLLFFKFLFGWDVVVCNLIALYVSGIVNFVMSDRVIFR